MVHHRGAYSRGFMSEGKKITINWEICGRVFDTMLSELKDMPTQVLMIQCIGVLAIFKNMFVSQEPENLEKFNKFVVDTLTQLKGQNQPEPGEPIASE